MTNRAIALLALSLAALCLSGAGLASAEPARVCRVTETTSYPDAGSSQEVVKLSCSKTALLVDLVAAMGTAQAACFPANDLEHWECIR